MATDASQFEFGAAAPAPMEVAPPKPRRTFGGMTPMQLAIGAALIAALVWGMTLPSSPTTTFCHSLRNGIGRSGGRSRLPVLLISRSRSIAAIVFALPCSP